MRNDHADAWMQQLLNQLASHRGLAVPLQPLLARLQPLRPQPQQLFDGIRLLLESGRVQLCRGEEPGAGALLSAEAPGGARHGPRSLPRSELMDLAFVVATACGHGDSAPARRREEPDYAAMPPPRRAAQWMSRQPAGWDAA